MTRVVLCFKTLLYHQDHASDVPAQGQEVRDLVLQQIWPTHVIHNRMQSAHTVKELPSSFLMALGVIFALEQQLFMWLFFYLAESFAWTSDGAPGPLT